jgi:LCP family protein required for cell wall assembly
MVTVGAVTFALAGAGALAAQIAVNVLNSSLNSDDLLADQRVELAGSNIEGPLNFLVLGTDERVGAGGLARTDAILIVHVNADLTEVSLVSIPRDLKVDIPTCRPQCNTKITEAFASDPDWKLAFANTAATVTELTGVRFHGGAIANFEGFLDLVDELGTIELCPWHELKSEHTGKVYPGECARYDKKDALDIVRQRKQWYWDEDWENGRGGDFGRQKMQQQAIKGILKEAKAQGYHTDPGKAANLLSSFGQALTTDTGSIEVVDLIVALRDIDPEQITTMGVPSTAADIGGTSYVITHEGEEMIAAEALYQAIRDDTLGQWALRYPQWVSSND